MKYVDAFRRFKEGDQIVTSDKKVITSWANGEDCPIPTKNQNWEQECKIEPINPSILDIIKKELLKQDTISGVEYSCGECPVEKRCDAGEFIDDEYNECTIAAVELFIQALKDNDKLCICDDNICLRG